MCDFLGRIYESGRRRGIKGKVVGVQSNPGFMARRVEGVIIGMKTLLEAPEIMSNLDYKVAPVPWNERLFSPAKKRLKIGYYTDDGYFPLTPACKRAVEVAIEALDAAGCEIVYFKPPNLEDVILFFFDHILADGGANSLEMWKGEILDQVIQLKARFFVSFAIFSYTLHIFYIFGIISNTVYRFFRSM